MSLSGQISGQKSQRNVGKYAGIVLLLPLLAGTACAQPQPQAYTHKNLTVFLIQGNDRVTRDYIPLEEAMDQKMIVLHETGNVGELSVDNKSDRHVFIMAGDIVKGGRQDRTIGEDIILNPGSKNIPLKSFCVEQSRWQKRGSESSTAFSASKNTLSSRNLKVAARSNKNQQEVWSEVAKYQDKASTNAKADVKSTQSQTSLQLTLENDELKTQVSEYIRALQPAFDGKSDILGFAFCVNGKVSTVEMFGNAALFARLQAKLLEAAANEAFAQYEEKMTFAVPACKDVEEFIALAGTGSETVTTTAKTTTEHKRVTAQTVMFTVFNTGADGNPLHTSIYYTGDITGSNTKTPQYQYGGFQNSMNRVRN